MCLNVIVQLYKSFADEFIQGKKKSPQPLFYNCDEIQSSYFVPIMSTQGICRIRNLLQIPDQLNFASQLARP